MDLEENFNKKVAESPIVKEIIRDLNGLSDGQEKLSGKMTKVEDKVENLEKKMEAGFAEAKKDNTKVIQAVNELKEVVVNNKEEALKAQLKKTEEALDRKEKKEAEGELKTDKRKNLYLGTALTVITTLILDKFGYVSVLG